jgi:hypothetical protein
MQIQIQHRKIKTHRSMQTQHRKQNTCMQRNLRHTGRVMIRETGTDLEEDSGKERDTQRVASKDRKRERTLHGETERHTKNVNTRRRACMRAHAHTHTHKEKRDRQGD